jgi:hypothetical protein
MAAERLQIKVRPQSKLALVVREAAEAGTPVLVDTGDAIFELDVHPAANTADDEYERDSLFSIIGISTDGEPTDIGRYKREYLAEALTPKPR